MKAQKYGHTQTHTPTQESATRISVLSICYCKTKHCYIHPVCILLPVSLMSSVATCCFVCLHSTTLASYYSSSLLPFKTGKLASKQQMILLNENKCVKTFSTTPRLTNVIHITINLITWECNKNNLRSVIFSHMYLLSHDALLCCTTSKVLISYPSSHWSSFTNPKVILVLCKCKIKPRKDHRKLQILNFKMKYRCNSDNMQQHLQRFP